MTIEQLITQLKTTAMTSAAIQAIDNSYICQNPGIALQMIRARGVSITVTTNAGVASYQVAA